MDRYLIEVPHEEEKLACARVIRTFLQAGSHYLTQADWGCEDGDHRGVLIVEAADHEEARRIVPPPFQASVRVVRLTKYSMEQIDAVLADHS